MPNYFSKHPKLEYQFDSSGQITAELTDILVKFLLRDRVETNTEAFYPYTWKDEDRIDSLADMYYNDDDFYWLVMFSNNYFDMLNDFPMPNHVFNHHLYHRYRQDAMNNGYEDTDMDVLEYTKATVHEYRDADDDVIDKTTHDQNPATAKTITLYDHEIEKNENKRDIRLIDNDFAPDIENELQSLLNRIKSNR